MPRHRQFTDQQIVDALKQHPRIQDAAAALGISRQALLAYRKLPGVVQTVGLPPVTRVEQANKEHARERKAEIRKREREWRPDLDSVTDWAINAAQAMKDVNRLRNENACLRNENEVLKGRLSLLDRAEQKRREFALLVSEGAIKQPLGHNT